MTTFSFLEYTKNFISPVNQKVTNISDFNKLAILDKFSTLKIENPKLTKKEIAKQLGVSDRTLLRYATELGENIYQKRNSKRCLNPSKCSNCDFIAKNKTGLQAHIRSKHLHINRQNKIKKENTSILDKSVESSPEVNTLQVGLETKNKSPLLENKFKNRRKLKNKSDENLEENMGCGEERVSDSMSTKGEYPSGKSSTELVETKQFNVMDYKGLNE